MPMKDETYRLRALIGDAQSSLKKGYSLKISDATVEENLQVEIRDANGALCWRGWSFESDFDFNLAREIERVTDKNITEQSKTEGNEIMTNQINKLSISWGISKGRDTLGYNICRLDDRNNGRRFRTIGGGYDMVGTVFGEWLEANYQKELMEISQRAHTVYNQQLEWVTSERADRLYGMTYRVIGGRITLDGACGIDSIIRIAEAIGLEVERDYIAKGRRRGETIGWFVQMKKA